jgi:hypothetical protein
MCTVQTRKLRHIATDLALLNAWRVKVSVFWEERLKLLQLARVGVVKPTTGSNSRPRFRPLVGYCVGQVTVIPHSEPSVPLGAAMSLLQEWDAASVIQSLVRMSAAKRTAKRRLDAVVRLQQFGRSVIVCKLAGRFRMYAESFGQKRRLRRTIQKFRRTQVFGRQLIQGRFASGVFPPRSTDTHCCSQMRSTPSCIYRKRLQKRKQKFPEKSRDLKRGGPTTNPVSKLLS